MQHLEPWVQSSDEVERQRSMTCLLQLLKAYQAHSDENEPSRHLPLQGQILGRMVPRCSDPNLSIRQMSIDCIQITLKIAACMPGTLTLYIRRCNENREIAVYNIIMNISKKNQEIFHIKIICVYFSRLRTTHEYG